MKSLVLSLYLLCLVALPVNAQSLESAFPATSSATPSATPRTTYTDTSDTPSAGTVENTLALLMGGAALIVIGIRFTKI